MRMVPPTPLKKALVLFLSRGRQSVLIATLLAAARCCLSQEAYTPGADTNVFAWFKADALTLANGARVPSWSPSGGAMNQAVVQTSVRNQPTFQTNQQNGLPAVLFDGVASFLTNSTFFNQPQPFTLVLVYKYLGPQQAYGASFIGNDQSYSWAVGASQGYMEYYIQSESGVSRIMYPVENPADAAWHILMIVFNGSNSLFRAAGFDAFTGYGAFYGATNTPIAGTLGGCPIMGTLELGGQMGTNSLGNVLLGEVIIYDGDQGSTNGTNIFNYLGNRWNLSLAPPPRPPPFTLNWPDRRPLGMDVLGGGPQPPKNPRGWFNGANVDYVSAAGLVAFSNALMARASGEIAVLKSMNAQGVIVWDSEGDELQNMTWIGDPRKVPLLAPEMDAVADEFFAMYKNAGFRVGVALRPRLFTAGATLPASGSNGQVFVLTSAPFGQKTHLYTNGWAQTNAVPYGGNSFDAYLPDLTNKMQYAIDRWGASIFYIDSFGAIDNNGPQTLQALTNIAQAYPNVLLIPELGGAVNTNMFCASAPYLEPQYTGYLLPTNILSTYPKAWSVICVNAYDDYPSMLRSVAAGNIMLANSWFANPSAQYSALAYINGGTPQAPEDLRVLPGGP
jgi:hypothetical protein